MSDDTKKLVVLVSRGLDDERATVAWTLANAGIASGQEVTMFLVSSGVDLVRRGAADVVQMNPNDPSMKELIGKFIANVLFMLTTEAIVLPLFAMFFNVSITAHLPALIASMRWWMHPKLAPFYVVAALFVLPHSTNTTL